MLQQTQVKAVIPFWQRWMEELPTIQALARAKPQKLHKLWEGLGYYTRVRNLNRAAQIVVEQHRGKFPREFDDVLTLPGIGRYTAGAICSIAFNQPRPILDGNAIRVLTRVFGIGGNPREMRIKDRLWRIAEELVVEAARSSRSRKAGENGSNACSNFNQALMELGALVCAPRQPRCDQCPVAACCQALRQGLVEKLPNLGKRANAEQRRFAAFVAKRNGRYLVRRRPEGGVNAHLWEFPNIEIEAVNADLIQAGKAALGVTPVRLEDLCTIRHSITRYRISLEAFRVSAPDARAASRIRGVWRTPAQLRRLPFTAAHKRILARL